MNRRSLLTASAAGTATVLFAPSIDGAQAAAGSPDPAQRLARRYHFDDPDMDLFFVAALGWGPSGGLDIGQAFYVANRIENGNADSWVDAFAAHGEGLNRNADVWADRAARRNAGETRLKAFAALRSAWQFAGPGERFVALANRHKACFRQALDELAIVAEPLAVPYADKRLPGVFLPNADPDAPTVLVIGGADTCFEDLFLTLGRNLLGRGYAVALVDLPGQGVTQANGLYWEAEAEKPIAAVIDVLIANHGAKPGRIALVGLSLGGYFAARAAGHEQRLATVLASTPFPDPAALFAASVATAVKADGNAPPSQAAQRSRAVTFWKTGARTPEEFLARTRGFVADPSLVTLPFLSILGAGDSPVFAAQAHRWHETIRSPKKSFVLLDAASGADGHVQVNNRLRLAQECAAWLDEIFQRQG